ncbi:MAG: undecaprenyl/decaprenyl-phosphate alpha-N-acetylglucosaminyl 1-phosphate transferase [Bacteroidetes bacterium]|nr:undecaprenyl/decaprenyl-phosphate alpha-N-acetylglucosaminyl 1-phosphate transferase [Bacteroidota bacterium]
MHFTTGLFDLFLSGWLLMALSVITAFGITYFGIPIIVRVSQEKGLFDNPNERASHHTPTPSLGGVAVFASVIFSAILFGSIYMIAGMMIIFFLGLKDDLISLSPSKKLAGQLMAIFIIVGLGDIRIANLHGLFGIGEMNYIMSVLVTIFLILLLINSFNLIDGIDGLAAGIGILSALFFGIWFALSGHLNYAIFSASLIGSLMIFFVFNVFGKRNKIFLGDTGSMLIGLLISIFLIKFLEFESTATGIANISSSSAVAICVLIVPIFDTLRVFIVRVVKGSSPFKPDRNHIHHRLVDLTGSHLKATLIILFTNVMFIAFGLGFQLIESHLLIFLAVILATFLSYIPVFLTHRKEGRRGIFIIGRRVPSYS